MIRRNTNTQENPSEEQNPQKDEMEKYIDSLKNEPDKGIYEVTDTRIPDFIPVDKCWEITKKYAKHLELEVDTTLAGITAMVQKGGTNQSKKTLTIIIGKNSFDLNKFRQFLTNIDSKYTVRKFAKGIRHIIILIAQKNKWEGPLAKELLRINPNLNITPELAPWCNEIHADNYDCPNEIRDALVRREEQYKIIARTKTQQSKDPNKKPRKSRGKKKR